MTKTVTYGPILRKNDDGSFNAVMVETDDGAWVTLADHERLAREVAHLRKTCADFGVYPAKVPE